jgi:small GTP-binding protein
MRNTILIWLLLTVTILTGCTNSQQSNNIKDIDKPLTQSQINEIIATSNEGLIKDIDLSEVTKPDPDQQAEINQKMRSLGEKLKGKVTIENTNIVVARVNGEAVTSADWYFEKNWEAGKAENKNEPAPSNEKIFNNLLKLKVVSSTARKLGLYPPDDQINAYMADQRKYMEKLRLEEITVLLKAWNISEEEYFLLMEDRFIDSLAKANWGVYLQKYLQEEEQGYAEKSPLWIDDKIISLLEQAEVVVTPEGRQLGKERAIVTDVPGTTRDLIEEYVNIRGIPVRIIDTAGIRDTSDLVEKLGINRAKQAIKDADLIILVLDVEAGMTEEDIRIFQELENKERIILLVNKDDLLEKKIKKEDIELHFSGIDVIWASIKEDIGIQSLAEMIERKVMAGLADGEQLEFTVSLRQKELLKEAGQYIQEVLEALELVPLDCLGVDMQNALSSLGQLTGKDLKEESIDRIFREFCIGK